MRHILVIAMILSFAFGALAEKADVVETKAEDVAKAAAEMKIEQDAKTRKVGFENAIAAKDDKKEEVKKEKKKSVKKSKKSAAHKKKKKKDSWSRACRDLLDTSVKSTIALEKKLQKKKKLSRAEFDEKVHEELLVVQLNAWVCAISSKNKVGAVSLEQKFLQDYSRRIQDRKL